jgi:hypothetical protein
MRAAFGLLAILVVLMGQVAPAHGSVSTGRRSVTARLLAHLPASCGVCEERDRDRVGAPPMLASMAAARDGQPDTPRLRTLRSSRPQVLHPRRLPPRSGGSDADAAH